MSSPRPTRDARHPRTRGFTLIEILVVISVIAILVTLLFPGVRATIFASKTKTTRATLAQIGIAIELFRDMNGDYPAGTYKGSKFSGNAVLRQLGERSLLGLKQVSLSAGIQRDASGNILWDNDKTVCLVDSWARQFTYTRFNRAPNTVNLPPGDDNLDGGIQPIMNPKTYDLFSCGPYADKLIPAANFTEQYETAALAHDAAGTRYTLDNKPVTTGAGKPTGETNYFIGNW